MVEKMSKDIGMGIRKSIVVSFLPCLVTFWGFYPYMSSHFFKYFFATCFSCFLGEEKYGCAAAACSYIELPGIYIQLLM